MQYLDYIIEHYGWQGTALAAALLVLFFVQMYYHLIVYGRVARFRNSRRRKRLDAEPPVSVIIPLFSEDYNYIDERLPLIMQQKYSTLFEVVIVYVGSDNDFYEELSNMRLRYPNLIVTKIQFNPRFPISVKMAINVGIKSAHNEHILITTTDATPASEQWLSMMGKAFMRGDIVLGYTSIEQGKGLTNYLIRLSRMQISTYWLSRAVVGKTYRGSRHNIGFTKSLYFSVKGFTHLNMNIGENDLFIQSIAYDNNASVVLIPKGRMIENQWGGLKWWIAHLHHYGEAYRYYPISARNAMEWDLGSQSLFFLCSLVALVAMPLEFKAATALLLLVRYLTAMLRARTIAKRVGEKGVALRYFIFDIVNPALMLCTRIAMMRKDSTAWK
ncbi:MAG: glycosyltransferase [Rikenellaceae bacterium]|nr:glycosyltransferase [Rikenellaceae bacterium]MBO7343758.1 glycosyltransferase [Alistipes sp.]